MPLDRSRLLPKLPWKALYLNGEDDYVEVSDSPSLDITSAITIEALINAKSMQSNDYPKIVVKRNAYILHIGRDFPNSITFNIFSNGELRQTYLGNILDADKWTFITTTYDGRYGKIYINGELAKTRYFQTVGTIDTNNNNIGIGAYPNAITPFNGYVAFIRIYNRALTEDEILWNYYHPDDPVRDGLVLWLHYDSIDEENGLWRDKTAYHNDGTIYGATPVEFTKPPIRKLMPTRILSPVR